MRIPNCSKGEVCSPGLSARRDKCVSRKAAIRRVGKAK